MHFEWESQGHVKATPRPPPHCPLLLSRTPNPAPHLIRDPWRCRSALCRVTGKLPDARRRQVSACLACGGGIRYPRDAASKAGDDLTGRPGQVDPPGGVPILHRRGSRLAFENGSALTLQLNGAQYTYMYSVVAVGRLADWPTLRLGGCPVGFHGFYGVKRPSHLPMRAYCSCTLLMVFPGRLKTPGGRYRVRSEACIR